MSKGPPTFRQRDVSAAMKAARDAGFGVRRVEITRDGKIVIVTGEPELAEADDAAPVNPWDKAVGLLK